MSQMNQISMFDTYKPLHRVGAKPINTGAALRIAGINKALVSAEALHNDWAEKAYKYLVRFLASGEVKNKGGKFKGEDVSKWAYENGLEKPPSGRAWGGIMLKGGKRNIIIKVGLGPVKNPAAHRANAGTWVKL
jgi:hypothetical protein